MFRTLIRPSYTSGCIRKCMRFFGTSSYGKPLSAKAQEFVDLDHKYGAQNYEPIEVVLSKGRGANVWDIDGNEYLDFISCYGAVNQGHNHPKIVEAFIKQAQELTLTSRAFFNDQFPLTLKYFSEKFGFDRSIFMNTGVEAGETAIKFARRWGYDHKGVTPNEATVLFAKNNFWGRTIAAVSSSSDPESYTGFGPYTPGFDLIEYDNIQALKEKLEANPNIVAYMVEPVQGEAGIVVPSEGYFKQVSELCKKHNVLLICDEVQTGLGRTGTLLAYEHEGIKPDVVVMAKSLSGGMMPVSCVMGSHEVMLSIKPGQHGSTFGGNPLGSVIARTAVDVLIEENMIENSKNLGQYFRDELKKIQNELPQCIKEVRGRGLMNAIVIYPLKNGKADATDLCYLFRDHGLLTKPTQSDIIRFTPPLVINKQQIDQGLDIIRKSLLQYKDLN